MNMELRPFPPLPEQTLALLNPEQQRLEALATTPAVWERLPDQELLSLLGNALLIGGILGDLSRLGPSADLYSVVMSRTADTTRLDLLTELSGRVETHQRAGTDCAVELVFLPFIRVDTSPRVVSSASARAAVLAGGINGDPKYGRTEVLKLVAQESDPVRKSSICHGLLNLSDPYVVDGLRGCWRGMADDIQTLLWEPAVRYPTTANVEFLMRWAEDARADGDAAAMARPLKALTMIALTAEGKIDGPRAGRGIARLERNYPAAAQPPEKVVLISEALSVEEVGRQIEPRLRALCGSVVDQAPVIHGCLTAWHLNPGNGGTADFTPRSEPHAEDHVEPERTARLWTLLLTLLLFGAAAPVAAKGNWGFAAVLVLFGTAGVIELVGPARVPAWAYTSTVLGGMTGTVALTFNRGDFMLTSLLLGALAGVAVWRISTSPSVSKLGLYAAIGSGALISVGALLKDVMNGFWAAIPVLVGVGTGMLISQRATTLWGYRVGQAMMLLAIVAPLVWWAAKALLQ